MPRVYMPLAAFAVALALVGCNETDGSMGPPATSVAQLAPAASNAQFQLPPGAPCSNEIDRYQAVVKDDLATGNVEKKVYDQIEKELARAAAACSAGQGGEAHSIVASSKSRHGYKA